MCVGGCPPAQPHDTMSSSDKVDYEDKEASGTEVRLASSPVPGAAAAAGEEMDLNRGLKSRHLTMISIGGVL